LSGWQSDEIPLLQKPHFVAGAAGAKKEISLFLSGKAEQHYMAKRMQRTKSTD
jgi:hypothetical protein